MADDTIAGAIDDRQHWRRRPRSFSKLLLAGFVATSVMNLLMFMPRVAGWPNSDIALLLSGVLPGGEGAMRTWNWWIAMGWHYLNGMLLFPLLYVLAFDRWAPGHRVARGLYFSLGLWVLIELVVLPLLGAGPAGARLAEPTKFSLTYLLGHVGYGLMLGGMAGAKDGFEARLELARRSTRRMRLALP